MPVLLQSIGQGLRRLPMFSTAMGLGYAVLSGAVASLTVNVVHGVDLVTAAGKLADRCFSRSRIPRFWGSICGRAASEPAGCVWLACGGRIHLCLADHRLRFGNADACRHTLAEGPWKGPSACSLTYETCNTERLLLR